MAKDHEQMNEECGDGAEQNDEKRSFFEDLAKKYIKEMRVLFVGGQLRKKDGWRNVAEHCLMQLAAAEELCALLRLSTEETKAICSTAAIHDWKKRWERTKQNVPDRAHKLLEDVHPRQDLLNATNPDYLEQVYEGSAPFTKDQELMLYLDVITKENNLAPSEDRLREVEASPRSKGLAEKAHGQYWQKTRALRDVIEQKLFETLRQHGCDDLRSPADIPLFLRSRIEAKWQK